DLRPRDWPVPSPDDASRLSRRLLLEPRPCLVALWLHALVFADRADGVSGGGDAQRRLLPGKYGAGRRDAVRLWRAGGRAALALAGGPPRLRPRRVRIARPGRRRARRREGARLPQLRADNARHALRKISGQSDARIRGYFERRRLPHPQKPG